MLVPDKGSIFAGLNSCALRSSVEKLWNEVDVVLGELERTLGGVAGMRCEVAGALVESPSSGVYQREDVSPPFPFFSARLSRVKRRAFASSGMSCRSDLRQVSQEVGSETLNDDLQRDDAWINKLLQTVQQHTLVLKFLASCCWLPSQQGHGCSSAKKIKAGKYGI